MLMRGSATFSSSTLSRRSVSSARQAANICLACPLLILCSLFLTPLLHKQLGVMGRPVIIAISFVAIILFLIGAIAGLMAIVSAPAGQRGLIITRASLGFILFALVGLIMVPNFFRARWQARQLHNRSIETASVLRTIQDYASKMQSHQQAYEAVTRQLAASSILAVRSLQH